MSLKKLISAAVICTLPALPAAAADFAELAEKCAPSVSLDTLEALVQTESGFNPFAIGVVGQKSVKQPASLQEALLKVSSLVKEAQSFSVGLGQINSANFEKLNVTAEELFDPCTNLKAVATILGQCYVRMSAAGKDSAQTLGDALSCYYSGNAKTGYDHGYVARVVANAPPVKIPSIRLLTPGSAAAAAKQPDLITSGTSGQNRGSALIF